MIERIIAMAPALMGEGNERACPTKPMIMFTVVRPTPTMKLAHTAALLMRLLYRPPQHRAEEGAGQSTPGNAHELRNPSYGTLVLEHRDKSGDGHEDDK
ncbi:MAG TPA: hypothetical protein OIM11_05445 [Coriobacteriaceae bacterium]|nr:hypothetical protein [Coriobacteriaceae bacterium]